MGSQKLRRITESLKNCCPDACQLWNCQHCLWKWTTSILKFWIGKETTSNQRPTSCQSCRQPWRSHHHHPTSTPPYPSGQPKVMQHADPKSIDLSPSFRKDWAPLPPLPLIFPGVCWWVLFASTRSYVLRSVDVWRQRMACGPIRVQDGLVPWRLCPPHSLSESLGPYTFLIALVIWLLWHELCLMTTTLACGLNYIEGRQAGRQTGCLGG